MWVLKYVCNNNSANRFRGAEAFAKVFIGGRYDRCAAAAVSEGTLAGCGNEVKSESAGLENMECDVTKVK